MTHLLDSYRRNAELARIEADQSPLPKLRARAVVVAQAWSEMADRQEQYEMQLRERDAQVVHCKEDALG